MPWIWEDENWANLHFSPGRFKEVLDVQQEKRRHFETRLSLFGMDDRSLLSVEGTSGEVLASSVIEGETFSPEEVRSSVSRRLGLESGALLPVDQRVEGIVQVVLDATRQYDKPLDRERLFSWHRLLFPGGVSTSGRIETGVWRRDLDGPMRVISGPMGREREHYRAPPADRLECEMSSFLSWFEDPVAPGPDGAVLDPVIKSALAHFRFVTIHPFSDGNGRIARAIADLHLARAEGNGERWYSMSVAIRRGRAKYYELLEQAQRGQGDLDDWLSWYLSCRDFAMSLAEERLEKTARAMRFWTRARGMTLNERQRAMLTLLLGDFEGKLTSSKWAALSHCSQDSAGRDIAALVEAGILVKGSAGGRSTSYEFVDE